MSCAILNAPWKLSECFLVSALPLVAETDIIKSRCNGGFVISCDASFRLWSGIHWPGIIPLLHI